MTPIRCCCLLVVLLALTGCAERTVETPPARTAAPTYTGPVYLRGTIGSMSTMRNVQPLPVSGLGVVVNLAGTGSSEVPAVARQRLINELARRGVGSTDSPLPNVSPEQLLADVNTAVVRVDAILPAGTTPGTRFDLLVSAADTQTTSLAGGDLWPVSLSIGGSDPSLDTREVAEGAGPIYVDPLIEPGAMDNPETAEFRRRAVVLSGGRAMRARPVEFVLNQPSYRRARLIESRINERYPAAVEDRQPTAVAKSDVRVQINIPRRWRDDPTELLRLIEHLYLSRAEGFAAYQARTLGNVLRNRPQEVDRIVMAWRSLGPNALPVLRELYDDPDFAIAFAAVEAGARLGDERAAITLAEIAQSDEPAVRERVARTLAFLPRSLRGASVLAELLDDPVIDVRLAAYDALAAAGDPLVQRVPVGQEPMKFILDRVPAQRPLIYVNHNRRPRLAVFGDNLEFDRPLLARMWDNRLMFRVNAPGSPLVVFYQKPGTTHGETYDLRPDLATLLFFLGHEPTRKMPQPGLDLSYGQVVDIVHRLCREGHLDAEFRAVVSELAARVADARRREVVGRPEVTPLDPDADLQGPAPDPAAAEDEPDADAP